MSRKMSTDLSEEFFEALQPTFIDSCLLCERALITMYVVEKSKSGKRVRVRCSECKKTDVWVTLYLRLRGMDI